MKSSPNKIESRFIESNQRLLGVGLWMLAIYLLVTAIFEGGGYLLFKFGIIHSEGMSEQFEEIDAASTLALFLTFYIQPALKIAGAILLMRKARIALILMTLFLASDSLMIGELLYRHGQTASLTETLAICVPSVSSLAITYIFYRWGVLYR